MTHQPKTLALLISLIGAGVAPSVQASADLAVVRVPAPVPSSAIEPPDITALDLTRWSQGLVWRTEEAAPEFNRALQVMPEFIRAHVDWSPGEVSQGPLSAPAATPEFDQALQGMPEFVRAHADWSPGEVSQGLLSAPAATLTSSDGQVQVQDEPGTAVVHPESTWRAAQVRPKIDARSRPMANAGQGIASDPKRRFHEGLKRVRTLAHRLGPMAKSAASVWAGALARPEVMVQAIAARFAPEIAEPPWLDTGTESGEPPAATVRFAACVAPLADDGGASALADRLMQSLAAILHEDVTALSRDQLLSTVAARFPAAFDVPPRRAPQAVRKLLEKEATGQLIERQKIVVASNSDRVLRTLAAIVSSEHKGSAALAPEPDEVIVATQTDRVYATLLEVTAPRHARERQDARELRKQRKQREAAIATLSADAVATPSRPVSPPLAVNTHEAINFEIERSVARVAVAVAPLVAPMAASTQPPARLNPLGTEVLAVSESSLDRVRGGFVTESLNISFGIERAVYVNGALVTSTSLNVSDLGRITAGRGAVAFDSGTLALIQSGAGNLVSAGGLTPMSLATVVQNTLDGQHIQSVTVINATVNSLSLLRGLNLQSSLRGAVIDSLRR